MCQEQEKEKSAEVMEHLRKIMEGVIGLAAIVGDGVTSMVGKVVEQVSQQQAEEDAKAEEGEETEEDEEKADKKE